MPSVAKSASLVTTLAGGLVNSFLTLQLAGSWSTLRALDAESELDAWKFDGLRVLWALLGVYLLAAAFVSFVGFFGVLRNKPSHVRLYRDCASADLFFTAFLTVLAFVAARAPARAACEQPELSVLLSYIYSNSNSYLSYFGTPVSPDESCERALEHAAVVALAGLVALTVVRLHFLLAVGAHYSAMVRETQTQGGEGGDVQRIRLLPLPRGVSAGDVVYAPVHCPQAANSLLGTSAEVWVRAAAAEAGSASASSSTSSLVPSPTQKSYAPAYVVLPQQSGSPVVPAYAPAYVQSTEQGQQQGQVPLDAGLLDARVVGTKREWI
ncbi:hypothetical protein MVEN_01183700 [Mycena venus]|uniref:Uncharacterized protein n=1 Tax=Mycena venus TaxID=2733690 RepID=A0A8H6Y5D2_9AGAR|nr:hypothetical protein MVEN_01183700 [Mycena venus]